MLFLVLSTFIVFKSYAFEFRECSETCMSFFPNLSNTFAQGYDPTKSFKIMKPNIATKNKRNRRHLHEEELAPSVVDLSDHPLHVHENYVCYGRACIEFMDDYDKFITPYEETVYGRDIMLPVHFAMTVFAFSVSHGTFWMDFMLEMTWEDNRLKLCLCDDQDNIRDTIFPREILDKVFVPDIVFLDSIQADRMDVALGQQGIWLTEFTGGLRLLYKRRMTMTMACFLNFRWYPLDVNACPVLLSTGLDHVFRVNLIMTSVPHNRHIRRGESFYFNVEPLPEYIGSQSFKPYTRYGISNVQHFTGFSVIIRRKTTPPRIYDQYLTYFAYIISLLMLVPLRNQKLSAMGLIGIGIGTVYTHFFQDEIVDYELRNAFRVFPGLYFFVLCQTGVTMFLASHCKSRYPSGIFCISVKLLWIKIGIQSNSRDNLSLLGGSASSLTGCAAPWR